MVLKTLFLKFFFKFPYFYLNDDLKINVDNFNYMDYL